MSRSVSPSGAVPGQAGKVLTIWALTASGSFTETDENGPLLSKITVSSEPGISTTSPGNGRSCLGKCNWRNLVVAVCLWLVYTLCCMAYSIINPFFPQNATSKGASSVMIGVIISSSPLCVFALSPILGCLLPHVAVWLQVLCGLLLVGCSYVSLAFVVLLPSGWIFVVICVVLRSVEGVGTAIVSTAIFSTFPTLFPDSVATLVGIFELGLGVGWALGPSIGGVMYQYGGYRLPFLSVGGVLLLFVLPCTLLVRKMDVTRHKKRLPAKITCKLATNVPFMALVVVVALSYNPGSYFAPSLPAFLDKWFPQSPVQIGFLYVTGAVTYILAAFIAGPLIDKVGHNRLFTMFGLLIMTLAYLTISLPYYVGYMNIWFVRLFYAVIYIGDAFTVVPIYSDLLKIGERYMSPDDNRGALSSFVSGLITSAGSFSLIIGPLGGGAATTFLALPEFALILGEIIFAEVLMLTGLSVIDWLTN